MSNEFKIKRDEKIIGPDGLEIIYIGIVSKHAVDNEGRAVSYGFARFEIIKGKEREIISFDLNNLTPVDIFGYKFELIEALYNSDFSKIKINKTNSWKK